MSVSKSCATRNPCEVIRTAVTVAKVSLSSDITSVTPTDRPTCSPLPSSLGSSRRLLPYWPAKLDVHQWDSNTHCEVGTDDIHRKTTFLSFIFSSKRLLQWNSMMRKHGSQMDTYNLLVVLVITARWTLHFSRGMFTSAHIGRVAAAKGSTERLGTLWKTNSR